MCFVIKGRIGLGFKDTSILKVSKEHFNLGRAKYLGRSEEDTV